MEPGGCNRWQRVANTATSKTAQIAEPLPWVAINCRRNAMVRRGSTVRVHQRALQKPRKIATLPVEGTCTSSRMQPIHRYVLGRRSSLGLGSNPQPRWPACILAPSLSSPEQSRRRAGLHRAGGSPEASGRETPSASTRPSPIRTSSPGGTARSSRTSCCPVTGPGRDSGQAGAWASNPRGSSTTTTVGPGSWWARARTRPARPTLAARRGDDAFQAGVPAWRLSDW
jgi:hypothetical protein